MFDYGEKKSVPSIKTKWYDFYGQLIYLKCISSLSHSSAEQNSPDSAANLPQNS